MPAKYSEDTIREAVDLGCVTAAYRADRQAVIDALNKLRATEFASYLQYKQHAYMAVSLLSPGLKADFAAHADLELGHADMLGERIQQLGGVPVYRPHELARQAAEEGVSPEQGATLTDMVVENLMLERQQIESYTNLIRELRDGDPTTTRLLLTILEVTERHASELADYLKRVSETTGRV
ncbi:MAG TPA: ferritin-like domain-containing protein [Chloroflexota bacterium]|nr:ferritin-like domain-containing protein [Chloroflexota bacterium]